MPKTRPLPPYIQKRRRRYYAVLEIPKALRHHYAGKVRLVTSLQTDSLAIAQRRVGPVVGAWQSEFSRFKNDGDDAAFYRRRLQQARRAGNKTAENQVLAEIELAHGDMGPAYFDGMTDEDRRQADEAAAEAADDFVRRATGQLVGFTDHLDAFLERSGTTEKTKAMQRSDVNRFAASFPTVQDVTVEGVQRWVDALGVAPATIQRSLSALRGYWRYLQRPDVKAVPREFQPFTALDLPKPRNSPGDRRKPFAPSEVVRLLLSAREDVALKDLILLGMWTGCRLEEICSLKTKHIHLDAPVPYLEIEDAKTPAGWRQVPVHSQLHTPLARLVRDSRDGYVLSGLTKNKYGDRSNAIGKRFGHLKKELDFGPSHVFHSIRRTVVTILENAQVPENVVADIVGHEKPRITYGLYSGGASLQVKAKALAKLSYAPQRG